ncbi:syndecan-1 [Pelobates fuscus]|uniref:syndecan-1 n=1 Tax=Pelobates fuscus TaxID=191477 RepID=UPI002FE4626F
MVKVFAVLSLLALCCSMALGEDLRFPVDDDDGSADDEDYSGSGFEDPFIFPSEVENEHSGSISTVIPINVQEPTEPDLRNATVAGVEATTKSMDTTKQQEDVMVKINQPDLSVILAEEPTSEAKTHMPTPEVHVTTSIMEVVHHHKTTLNPTEAVLPDKIHHGHHGSHAKAHTSPPSDGEFMVHHTFTTSSPDQAKDSIHHHIHHQETPSSTPRANEAETELTYVEDPIFVDLDKKQTTKSPTIDDSHVHQDEQTTKASSFVEDTEDHYGEATTSPAHDVEVNEDDVHHIAVTTSSAQNVDIQTGVVQHDALTTSPTHYVESKEEASTPADDVDKHHKHHGGHHHHSTTTTHQTTTSNVTVGAPVSSGDLHISGDTRHKGRFFHRPEDHPVETSTHTPDDQHPIVPDENDDVSDTKEDGESGDDKENVDLYFEGTAPNVHAVDPKDRSVDSEGSPDASHGIMERKELLAGIIAGGAVGLIFAGFLVGFVLYRMKKKDEGSYSLEEPKQSNGGYQKPREQKEFYA